MSIKIEIIREDIILLRYSGVLNYDDRLTAYTQVSKYAYQHDVKYILLDMENMMYFEDQVVDERLNNLIQEVLGKETCYAVISTTKNNEALGAQFQANFAILGVNHKFYQVSSFDEALSLIEQLEHHY